MPDSIRITGGSFRAQPPHKRLCASITAAPYLFGQILQASPAYAATGEPGSALDSLLAIQIDRPELIALALTLGILCFAVVTSIMLVRTSRRLAETEESARDGMMAARGEAYRDTRTSASHYH